MVGINERAVPVEENSFNGASSFRGHGSTEYQQLGEGRIRLIFIDGRKVWKSVRKRAEARELGFQITGRDAVVAVKLDIIEDCSDAMPARHGGRFCSAHTCHGCSDNVAEAQGFAYQHNFQFDRSANRQLPGTQKIDARGTDVASDQRYGKFLGHSASTAKTQRKVQAGTGIFTLFGMDTHGVRGHADKTPRLLRVQKWGQSQLRNA